MAQFLWFCPICGMAHGTRATKKVRNYIILEQAPYLETVTFESDKPFGVILEAMGRGKGKEVKAYLSPEDRPEDFLMVKTRMLTALKEWIDKGWIEKETAMEMIAAATPRSVVVKLEAPVVEEKEEVIKPPVVLKPPPAISKPPKTIPKPPPAVPLEILTPEALAEKWYPLKKSLKLLKQDIETLRGRYDLEDVDGFIEEYEELERDDYDTASEYKETKDEAWENILGAFPEASPL